MALNVLWRGSNWKGRPERVVEVIGQDDTHYAVRWTQNEWCWDRETYYDNVMDAWSTRDAPTGSNRPVTYERRVKKRLCIPLLGG